jgi:hypothetical protein
MPNRHGEKSKAWFRCERYYHTADGWWFQTRELTEKGPFTSEHEAEMELCLYIRKVNLNQQSFVQQKIF